MEFDESTAPEALKYNFTKWGGVRGEIPEPTEAGMQAYVKFHEDLISSDQGNREDQLRAEANAITEAAAADEGSVKIEGDLPDFEDLAAPEPPKRRTLREIILGDPDEARRTAEAVGEVCQHSPSVEQIWALPYRPRVAFINWISNILLFGSPEGYRPVGTSGSPAGDSGDGSTTSPAAT